MGLWCLAASGAGWGEEVVKDAWDICARCFLPRWWPFSCFLSFHQDRLPKTALTPANGKCSSGKEDTPNTQVTITISDIYWWLIMCQALCYWSLMITCGGGNNCCPMWQMRKLKHREVNFLAKVTQPPQMEQGLGWVWLQSQMLWCLCHGSSAAKRQLQWYLQRSEL